MMTIAPTRVTVAEFEQFAQLPENRERHFELIDGEIVEKMVTFEHGAIVVNISSEIRFYLRNNPIGRVATEVQHRREGDDTNERIPDISVVIGLEKPIVREGATPYLPDLAVEVKSPTDKIIAMRRKAERYSALGTRLVWLVFPETKTVEVYSAAEDSDVVTLGVNDMLDGGDVLPGFSLAVGKIFTDL